MITNAHISDSSMVPMLPRAQCVCVYVFSGSGAPYTARYTAARRKPKLTQSQLSSQMSSPGRMLSTCEGDPHAHFREIAAPGFFCQCSVLCVAPIQRLPPPFARAIELARP